MNNFTLWFTGLSGSGKSTIANKIKEEFKDIVLLDGDVLRTGLCSDLKFSIEDRTENMRRLRELCKLFNLNGKNVITAFISPLEEERIKAKNEISNCKIIWCNSSLETCEKRDVKGLYKKARDGEIKEFTGITSPFDNPECADYILDTNKLSINECVNEIKKIVNFDSLEFSKSIALSAHIDQKRWEGIPYFTHLESVANMCETNEQKIVSYLHDVIEDTDITLEYLKKYFSSSIINAIDNISKRKDESYIDYILRVKNDQLATYVKIRDIKHNKKDLNENIDIDRIRIARYDLALYILGD